eukprot:31158-Pelagococcus_subviridis.AAC.5
MYYEGTEVHRTTSSAASYRRHRVVAASSDFSSASMRLSSFVNARGSSLVAFASVSIASKSSCFRSLPPAPPNLRIVPRVGFFPAESSSRGSPSASRPR